MSGSDSSKKFDENLNKLRHKRARELLREKQTVSEEDFVEAMNFLKEMRLHAIQNNLDPWAVRQALIFALEFDTMSMLSNPKISKDHLDNFDKLAIENARELAEQFEKSGPPASLYGNKARE